MMPIDAQVFQYIYKIRETNNSDQPATDKFNTTEHVESDDDETRDNFDMELMLMELFMKRL